jgi:hypothetical protein
VADACLRETCVPSFGNSISDIGTPMTVSKPKIRADLEDFEFCTEK